MISKKLKKKAQEAASYVMFIIVLFLVIFIFLLGMFSTRLIKARLEAKIKEDITNANYAFLVSDILKAPAQQGTLADMLSGDFSSGNYDITENALNGIIETYLGKDTDWELFIEGDKVKSSCSIFGCSGKKHYSEAILPLIDTKKKENIRVGMKLYFAK